jgi:DNA polymerase V
MSGFFALIDCNNFYASCECVFDPSLKDRPIAILSNNDGCIVARSQKIKDMGIKMGTPYYKAEAIIRRHNGVVFSSNYELYGSMSERVMSTLRTFSSDIEMYSIDEAFVRLNDNNELTATAINIAKTVKKWTGIPVKIGIAQTKTLCKVAAELVKKNMIEEGYCILTDKYVIKDALEVFDIADIWGIGRKTALKLNRLGIQTAKQLCCYPRELVEKKYGINLLRTVMELEGIQCYCLETTPQPKQSMCYSRSFGKTVTKYDEMRESIVFYATGISENLRKDKQLASAVTVYITTNRFKNEDLQYSNSYTLSLSEQTSSTQDIVKCAVKCLEVIFRKGYRYKKSGVILSGLVNQKMSQGNLFSKQDDRDDRISSVMDNINKQFGSGSVKFAAEGVSNQEWKMLRGHLSKHYTTDWNELLEIKE